MNFAILKLGQKRRADELFHSDFISITFILHGNYRTLEKNLEKFMVLYFVSTYNIPK